MRSCLEWSTDEERKTITCYIYINAYLMQGRTSCSKPEWYSLIVIGMSLSNTLVPLPRVLQPAGYNQAVGFYLNQFVFWINLFGMVQAYPSIMQI